MSTRPEIPTLPTNNQSHIMRRVISICILAGIFLAAFCSSGESAGPSEKTTHEVLDLQPFTHAADFFPILCWNSIPIEVRRAGGTKKALESVAECGFTAANYMTPEDLPLCEKLGVTALVSLPSSLVSGTLDQKQLEEKVKEIVGRTAGSKALLGFHIMDEPKAENFPAVARVVAAVKKYAPGKLAYVNLLPSNVGLVNPKHFEKARSDHTKYLERYVAEVKPQFLCYDNYMVQYSDDLRLADVSIGYYGDLLAYRRIALKHGLPFWNVVASSQIRKWMPIPSPANLAFQAYTTLAAGGRGLSWYTYYQGGYAYAPIDTAGNKTETWRYLQVVNSQVQALGPIMNHLRSTGVFFTSPPPAQSLPVLPGRVIKRVQARASVQGIAGIDDRVASNTPPTVRSKAPNIATVNQPIMVGEFVDEHGADYVMLVNISLERSVNVKLDTVKTYNSRYVYSAADGRRLPLGDAFDKGGIWLLAGHGVLIKLEEQGAK